MARSRLARRYSRRRGDKKPTPNPGRSSGASFWKSNPALNELADTVLPGFAGYGSSRLLSRVVRTQVGKRWPRWSRHAGVATAVLSFAAVWAGASRVRALQKYETPLLIGTGVAGLQAIIQAYVPWLGWMVSDVEDVDIVQLPAGQPQATGADPFDVEDSVFDEVHQQQPNPPPAEARDYAPDPAADGAAADAAMNDILADLGVEEDLGAGIFSN